MLQPEALDPFGGLPVAAHRGLPAPRLRPWGMLDAGHVLALTPSAYSRLRGLRGADFKAKDARTAGEAAGLPGAGPGRAVKSSPKGGVAIIPVVGFIDQHPSMWTALFGCSCSEIAAQLRWAAAENSIGTIVLVIDSPGGSVFGVQELADTLYEIGGKKRTIAVADSVAASAAYWIGSSATELIVTPGGQVGSIGVIVAHEDVSGALEQAGIKVTLLASSPGKADGAPEFPLSDTARADLQSKVDAYHTMFVRAVSRGRAAGEARVRSDFGQGRMVLAADAVKRGMADKVATLADVFADLGVYSGRGAPGVTSAHNRLAELGL